MGEAIALNILENLELAYHGADAMAGQSKGAAACTRYKHPKTIYMHCASHRLNLCVVKCCNI